jgi:hypothetical protein
LPIGHLISLIRPAIMQDPDRAAARSRLNLPADCSSHLCQSISPHAIYPSTSILTLTHSRSIDKTNIIHLILLSSKAVGGKRACCVSCPSAMQCNKDTAAHVNCISPIKPPCIPCMHHLRNVTDDLTLNSTFDFQVSLLCFALSILAACMSRFVWCHVWLLSHVHILHLGRTFGASSHLTSDRVCATVASLDLPIN